MAGAAISGFVDGLFQGIGARHGWEDRKRNIGRERRQDEIRDNVDRRSEEEHRRRMGVYDREASDWSRGREDQDFWRTTFQDAADLARTPDPAQPPMVPPPQAVQTPQVSTKAAPPNTVSPSQGVAMELGIDPRMVQTNRGAAMMERLSPASELAAAAEAAVVTPRRAGANPAQAAIDAAPARPPTTSNRIQFSPDGTAQIVPAMNMPDNPRLLTEGPGPGGGIEQLYDQGILPRRYVDAGGTAAPKRQAPDISPDLAASMVRQGIVESPSMPLDIRRMAAGVESLPSPSYRGGSPATGAVTSQEGRAAMGALSRTYQDAITPQTPAVAPPPSIPMKAAATPQDKQASATAVETLDTTATPETQDATVAATQAMGVQPGQTTITPAQYKRGSQAFIDRYMEVGAPKVLEALISRGEFDKAEAFQKFMQSAETRAGMKDWSMAAAAATLGDIDKFGTHIISAYNRMGYFPDGTELVETESGFTKGRDGAVNGARLTFKDAATGQKFEQVFNGPDDLIKTGITLLAPENAFEFYWKEQQAAAENAKGAMVEADKAAEAEKKDQMEVLKMAQDLVKSSNESISGRGVDAEGNPLPPLTMEQAIQQVLAARASIARGGQEAVVGPSGPPVAYRPTN